MWPAECSVFLYCGGGLPREAIRRGRRSMRGSDALSGVGVDGGFEGEVGDLILLLDFVILAARNPRVSVRF